MTIKYLRENQGLSQKALAEKAGVAQTTVHYIETGGNATQKTLRKLANALGVSVAELLSESKATGVKDQPTSL